VTVEDTRMFSRHFLGRPIPSWADGIAYSSKILNFQNIQDRNQTADVARRGDRLAMRSTIDAEGRLQMSASVW
jgi:hypothetical protein